MAATANSAEQTTVGVTRAQAQEYAQFLLRNGRLDEAAAMAETIAAAAPEDADAWRMRADIARRRGKVPLAGSLVRQALAAGHRSADLYFTLHDIEFASGRHQAALAAAERACELAPDRPDAFSRLAAARYSTLDFEGALAASRETLRLDPNHLPGHGMLAETLLLLGRYEEGWPEFAWRFRRPGMATPLVFPEHWDGSAWTGSRWSRGRLLLFGDQGLGDQIQYVRYLRLVAERCPGPDLVVSCAATLHKLIRPLLDEVAPGADLVTPDTQTPRCNAWRPMSLLPGLFGTRLDSIPGPHPYLHADPAAVALWRERLDARLPPGLRRVGLVWSGSPSHGNDRIRSMRLAMLAPLTELDGVALVLLQKGEAAEAEMQVYSGRAPLVSLGPELQDMGDTAAVLTGLDALVTIDSSPAHLAGALGVPTLLMLPCAPDWRWLLGRRDSPWYPSLRLFRQPALDAWEAVVAEVAAALAAWDVPASLCSAASAPR
jgi:hypothetical protein